MKSKITHIINNDKYLKDTKSENNYELAERYWKKRKKECEKNLSKFC